MAPRDLSLPPSETANETVDETAIRTQDPEDIPSDDPTRTGTPISAGSAKRPKSSTSKRPRPRKGAHVWVNESVEGAATDDEPTPVASRKRGGNKTESEPGTAVTTRRQANGTVGSVYSGSKIRHIKKPDGIPLWRIEIQYTFLDLVITNKQAVFTNRDGQKGFNFADIYIDCLARSSKTSKVLKERLFVDRPAAENMAMICLLVNVGRMNTTLNFFPEMRAQLRTYHSIPSLQAYPRQKDYKSLQDAPRLKSILKGASEDTDEPRTLTALRQQKIPRTNACNLIFVLSQAASEVSQLHFLDKIDFFDLAIRSTVSSESRARAFLWLMWWYLESNFDKDSALNNPFGPGEYRPEQDQDDPSEIPLLVPALQHITEEEGKAENVDNDFEQEFGEKMRVERENLNIKFAAEEAQQKLEQGLPADTPIDHRVKRLKRQVRETDDADSSDVDSSGASPGASRSARSPLLDSTGLQADSIEDDWELMDSHPGKGRYKRPKGKTTPSRRQTATGAGSLRGTIGKSRLGIANSDRGTPDTNRDTPVPLPPGVNHPILSQFPDPRFTQTNPPGPGLPMQTKSRARTGYQRELENHKQSRILWLVNKKRHAILKDKRVERQRRELLVESWLLLAAERIANLDTMYDSEEDDAAGHGLSLLGLTDRVFHHGTGLGGVVPDKNELAERRQRPQNEDAVGSRPASDEQLLEEDVGEDADNWVRVLRRTQRRLDCWSGDRDRTRHLSAQSGAIEQSLPGLPRSSNNQRPQDIHEETANPPRAPPRRSGAQGSSKRATIISNRNTMPRKKQLEQEIMSDILAERSDHDSDPVIEDNTVFLSDNDNDNDEQEQEQRKAQDHDNDKDSSDTDAEQASEKSSEESGRAPIYRGPRKSAPGGFYKPPTEKALRKAEEEEEEERRRLSFEARAGRYRGPRKIVFDVDMVTPEISDDDEDTDESTDAEETEDASRRDGAEGKRTDDATVRGEEEEVWKSTPSRPLVNSSASKARQRSHSIDTREQQQQDTVETDVEMAGTA